MRTNFLEKTDRQTDGQTDGQTEKLSTISLRFTGDNYFSIFSMIIIILHEALICLVVGMACRGDNSVRVLFAQIYSFQC